MKLMFPKSIFLFFVSILLVSCTKEATLSFYAMNTFMTVRSFAKNPEKANEAVRKRILQIEELISTTAETSDVYRLNHSDEPISAVSDETALLMGFSLNLAQKTRGALNPCLYPITSAWGFTTDNFRIPSDSEIMELLPLTDFSKVRASGKNISLEKNMMIDFGAVGKGFASDEAVRILKEFGVKSAVIDFGGNVHVIGKKKAGAIKRSDWLVGIKDPFSGKTAAAIKTSDKAVITSGGYERFFEDNSGKRYIHIFDGKTGKPAESNIASVTIVASSGLYADGLSTAMFVLGKDAALDFWRQSGDFEMILILNEDSIAITAGLKDSFRLVRPFKRIEILGR